MSNYDLIESNEVSQNAMGGTEMYMRFVYSDKVPRHLLENVQIIPRDRKSTRLNSSHSQQSRMPSSA